MSLDGRAEQAAILAKDAEKQKQKAAAAALHNFLSPEELQKQQSKAERYQVRSLLALLVQSTCFTGTKVRSCRSSSLRLSAIRYSVYLLYWYKVLALLVQKYGAAEAAV